MALTLALGIGGNTAVFSLINAIVLRPLPYPRSRDLYILFQRDSLGAAQQLASYPTFLDWREAAGVFSGLAFISGTGLAYRAGDESGLLLGSFVSDEFFPTFGVPAHLGRVLGPDDYLPGNSNVVVLSYRTWRGTFGGDPGIIGRSITLANQPFQVVGVMPSSFAYPVWGLTANDLWLPLPALPPPDLAAVRQRAFHADSRIVARLKPGVPVARAQEHMNAVARRLVSAYPEDGVQWTRVGLVPLGEFILGDVAGRLYLLAAAVAAVLLICCVNLANLYLAQGAARSQEFAIRAALGAARARVLRQLLAEALVVVSLGGALGIVLADRAVRLVRDNGAASLPRALEVGTDWRVLGFAVALTALTALLFAGVGARRVATPHLAGSLGERGGTGSSRGGRRRLPAWLLVMQVALTMVLLIGAGLLSQSFWRLSDVDPGFQPDRLASVRIMPPSPAYDDAESAVGLYRRVAESVAAVPGITQVALVNHIPLGSGGLPTPAAVGHAPTGGGDDFPVLYETVSAGYFATMRIPVVAGREFGAADLNGPPSPVIINRALARRWGGGSAIGGRLGVLKAARTRADFGQPLMGTVVGVVGDVKHFGLDAQAPPTVYVPYTHNPWAMMSVVARTATAAEQLVAPIERAVRQVDPAIPLKGPALGVQTFDTSLRSSLGPQRLNAQLVSAFAVVALFLAAIGIYGVMGYTVALEARDIGIRMALGAAPGEVLRGVVGRVARIAAIGVAGGVVAALALTRLLTGLLYQVKPTDAATFAGVGGLLLLVALLAGFLPARRAAAVDPLVALRS